MASEIPSVKGSVNEFESRVIEIFVDGARLMGLPRSVGEIYGVLYASPVPMCMEEIVQKLQISLGSASQGLKQLKSFKAVRSFYKAGDRRDFYEAELELRKLISGLLREEVVPHLESNLERAQSLQAYIEEVDSTTVDSEMRAHYKSRADALSRWQGNSLRLLKRLFLFIRR